MSDSEVGNEMNIRIEVENELYEHHDADDVVRMEEDVQESADDLLERREIYSTSAQLVQLQNNMSIIPMGLEDGECSSNSSESPAIMDVASGDEESVSPGLNNECLTFFESRPSEPRQPRRYLNPYVTGEIQKRASRAIRFGDDSFKAIPNVEELMKITDEELLDFYMSMGLMIEDGGVANLDKVNPSFRLDSVLIRGLNNMSTEEIFGYLYEQGLAPREMEWVNDACCIVIYDNKYEAAASFLKISKPISMDPERAEKKKCLLLEDLQVLEKDESLSLKDSPSEIKTTELDYDNCSVIPEAAITVPMPLGYVWRYVNPRSDKAKGILMRYAKMDDRKQEKAEKHSLYYKKFGNPNFRPDQIGRLKNDRTAKRARFVQPELIEQVSSSSEEEVIINNKNAWSVLSASWDKEEKGRNRVQSRVRTPIPNRIQMRSVPPMGFTSSSRNMNYNFPPSSGASRVSTIHTRLGNKQNISINNDFEEESKTIGARSSSKDKYNRKRVWSDDEEGDSVVGIDDGGEDEDDDERWRNRLTTPRMKMHADEEETRQKLKAIRRNHNNSRSTVFDGERLLPRDVNLTSKWVNPYTRRPVRERLGSRTDGGSTQFSCNHSEDYEENESYIEEDLDAHDLRELLDQA